MRESANSPAWSPDSNSVAYVALRDGYFGVYRRGAGTARAGRTAAQELGAADAHRLVAGRPLPHLLLDRPGGRRAVRAADRGTGERKPIEVLRNKFQLQGPRLSPDSRVDVVRLEPVGRNEVYVVPFDPTAAPGAAPTPTPTQVSDQGGTGMVFWRRDGKELFYLAADRA